MKQDFTTEDLKAELERSLGFRLRSLTRLDGASAVNFKAVRQSDGYAFAVKCSPASRKAAFDGLVQHLEELKGTKAVRRVFEREAPSTFRGYNVICLEWCAGRRLFPDQLSSGALIRFLDDYVAFSSAMQKTSQIASCEPTKRWRAQAMAASRGMFGAWLKRILEEELPESSVSYRKDGLSVVHGDFHHGNFLFVDGAVSGFFDLEEFCFGYPADDIVRYFVCATEHLGFFEQHRKRLILKRFAEAVRHLPYSRLEWRVAIRSLLLRKIHGKVYPGGLGFWRAANIAYRIGFYRRLLRIVDAADIPSGGMRTTKYPTGAVVYDIPYFVDSRGALNVLEIARELPFGCQRIFYTYTVPEGSVRGEHAHRKCEQFLIAVRGRVSVSVDDGTRRDVIELDSPSKGLHLPAGCWGEQFGHTDDCILMVLASQPYDSADYIRDYDVFIRWKNPAKMAEKDKFSILRNELIVEYANAPADIPCRETSDPAALPEKPLVSVVMTAYNHGKYIREAIEGVLKQETDFSFELVIGEDCSPDDTRAICLEYQRRRPDLVRVLWSDENVFGAPGGNENRIQAHCRGEFLAYCEGDDYWTDPHKLQKQVDLLRRHPEAGMCFGGTDYLHQVTGCVEGFRSQDMAYGEYVDGSEFASRFLFENEGGLYGRCLHTSATLVRRRSLEEARKRFPEIYRWFMRSTDYPRILGISAVAGACFLKEPVSVWRLENGTGLTQRDGVRATMDDIVCKIYFTSRICRVPFAEAVDAFANRLVLQWLRLGAVATPEMQFEMARRIELLPELKAAFSRWYGWPILASLRAGKLGAVRYRVLRLLFAFGAHMRADRALPVGKEG